MFFWRLTLFPSSISCYTVPSGQLHLQLNILGCVCTACLSLAGSCYAVADDACVAAGDFAQVAWSVTSSKYAVAIINPVACQFLLTLAFKIFTYLFRFASLITASARSRSGITVGKRKKLQNFFAFSSYSNAVWCCAELPTTTQ